MDHLPSTLIDLTLGDTFNRPVDHLPSRLENLRIGNGMETSSFNQPLDHLPPSLKVLVIGHEDSPSKFYQHLDNLPPSLHTLAVRYKKSPTTSFYHFPPNLRSLIITSKQDFHIYNLPTITLLGLSGTIPHTLPSTLTVINFMAGFNSSVDNLPHSVLHLYFEDSFNQSIANLPPNLLALHLGHAFNHPLDHLPHTLLFLQIHSAHFNYPVNNLPCSLETLDLSKASISQFKQNFISLPPHVKNLKLGAEYQTAVGFLPPSIEVLSIDSWDKLNLSLHIDWVLPNLKVPSIPFAHCQMSYKKELIISFL